MATFENWLNRRKGKNTGDLFKLDIKNKTPEQNIAEILQGLYVRKSVQNDTSPTSKTLPQDPRSGFRNIQRSNGPDNRRLSYLNALVTLLCGEDRNNLGFSTDELMTCIRISLVDDSMVVRAAALRVLRYLIKTESDVATFNSLKLPYLVIRSMDLMLRNEEERAQALRVVRRVIGVVGAGRTQRHRAAFIEPGLLRCLVAVARAGSAGDGTGDRLARPAIATLAEVGVLNSELFISCGGVNAVTRQLAECATPRMAEALCGVLLHVLNDPVSRRTARVDLTCLSSPYCDFHMRPAGTDTNRDEREMRLTCSRLALVCVLRSWAGVLHLCHPRAAGGLKAIVAALALPRLEVRKAILDLLYELVGLPQPEWTDEMSVALDAVDPSDFHESWRLNEGFVAAEGIAILPHLSGTGPDIAEIHLALLLQCFLEAGLLDGLAEVIVTSDTFISVRATVLLGQLLHLIHLYLPPQICSITPALPSLMAQAAAGKPQALAAVAALHRLHSILEARPASNSLFLDHIIQYCSGAFKDKTEDTAKSRKEKDNASMAKPKDLPIHKDNSIEFLEESDTEYEPKQRHSIGSRADVTNRNVSALVKSKSVSSRTSGAMSKVTKTRFFNLFERDSDNLLRCTLVMQNKDGNSWDWEIIGTILKENDTPFLNLNDSGHKAWVARIINYLKPSSNKYSHTDLISTCHGHSATRAGCQLIRHLLKHNDPDAQRLLEELFYDVSRQIEAIETGLKAHECLFSPQHMCNTMCQMYFLFIAQLCHSQTGLRLFKQTRLYDNLIELSTKTHHSCYVKLVISSLDYTLDSYPREILAKTLTCSNQASRLYATQFLNVLLRASKKSRELVRRKTKLMKNIDNTKTQKDESIGNAGVDMDTWILQMLIGQIKDEYKEVVKCSLSILEEAYSMPALVDKMITMRDILSQNCRLDKNAEPSTLDFSAVGDRGYLIWLGLEVAAIAQSSDAKSVGFVKKHLDFWTRSYNYRYVRLVEACAQEALTLCGGGGVSGGGGGAVGCRGRRAAATPPHLHAALARRAPASLARALLAATLPTHYKILQKKKCSTEQDIMNLKASMWAVGNSAVTMQGLQQVMNLSGGYLEDSVPVHIVRLAKYCPVYSVRASAFYVLGLIGTTYDGANILSDLGWYCVRHTRHDQFPIIPEETYLTYDAHSFAPSPDKRLDTYDAETSEHSDHTDQSVAESLPSEYTKHIVKTGSVLAPDQNDQDVVDHKVAIENSRDPDKRKSHTLPIQGCSTSHERPTLSESRTVDILRDCSSYERPHPPRAENRLLLGRMNSLEYAHEGRVRNTSESSTSGVSSCDSFLGKYALPDRILTLSPIPSSSSLYGMKSSSSSHRPRISEMQRRTSTSSYTTPEVASSPPSQMDMTGYATLKSLNKHRRPHLSESAATSSEMEDLSWLLADTNRRSKPFSSLRDRAKSTRERMTKLSLLEYDWKPVCVSEGRASPGVPPPRVPRPPPPPPRPHAPAYIGICLPKDLMDLFPSENDTKDDELPFTESSRRRVPVWTLDASLASNDKSRATPDSQKHATYRASDVIRSAASYVAGMGGFGSNLFSSRTGAAFAAIKESFNNGINNTNVAVAPNVNPTSTLLVKTLSKVVEDSIIPNAIMKVGKSNIGEDSGTVSDTQSSNTDTNRTTSNLQGNAEPDKDSSCGGDTNKRALNSVEKGEVEKVPRAASDTGTNSSKTSGMRANVSSVSETETNVSLAVGKGQQASEASEGGSEARWRHCTADCLACVPTRPPSSHQLREAFFAGKECGVDPRNTSSPVPDSSPQAEVLHHVHFMANPIHLRQTRSVLLSLKQRHPEVFRSPCVYSDVCRLLSRDTYMLCARRFLQELFLDTNFECFLVQPTVVLSRHSVTTSPINAANPL